MKGSSPLLARLDHLAVGPPDPLLLARFYEQVMGLSLSQTPAGLLAQGPERRLLFVQGPKRSLVFAAMR